MISSMLCAECEAFLSAYKMASEHYAEAVASLHKMASGIHFKTQDYQRLKSEVEQARNICEMARAALQVHKSGHTRSTQF